MKSKFIISTWLITILLSGVTSAVDRLSSQDGIKNTAPGEKHQEYPQKRVLTSPQQQPLDPNRDYNDHYPPLDTEGSRPQPTRKTNLPPS